MIMLVALALVAYLAAFTSAAVVKLDDNAGKNGSNVTTGLNEQAADDNWVGFQYNDPVHPSWWYGVIADHFQCQNGNFAPGLYNVHVQSVLCAFYDRPNCAGVPNKIIDDLSNIPNVPLTSFQCGFGPPPASLLPILSCKGGGYESAAAPHDAFVVAINEACMGLQGGHFLFRGQRWDYDRVFEIPNSLSFYYVDIHLSAEASYYCDVTIDYNMCINYFSRTVNGCPSLDGHNQGGTITNGCLLWRNDVSNA
ncbi:hypothetical protein B0H11DRAFT_2186236 [Mycena galericulata]|nr:hypothetical protein B0H11DRAFT_2186236 [Mycena galericulata]